MQLMRRIRGRAWRRTARVPIVLSTVTLCVISVTAAASASAGSGASAATGTSQNWASFHHGGSLEGWAPKGGVTTANAANLGVKWSTDVYGDVVDSPMVAYNSTLKEQIAYVGTLNGYLSAVNVATGQTVWSVSLNGAELRSSPVVANGAVWVSTFNSGTIYKFDAATGAMDCSLATAQDLQGTPVAATPPGGVPTVYFGDGDTNGNGPVYAVQQSNCAKEWTFTDYRTKPAGSWDPYGYAVDEAGTPLLLFGTADPDSTIYAINALTGKKVWDFKCFNPPPSEYDVGAGVDTTAPGVNGFADGMAYVETKYGIMYGLNLTTGAKVWSVNYTKEIGSVDRNISTAALDGHNLVLGDANGLVDLDPLNGAVVWHNDDPADTGVDSSPAISGPSGSQVVTYGDLGGNLVVDSLSTGTQLYSYQTGGYISGSPAVSGGNIVIGATNGFLYDFAAGGGNSGGSTAPTTTVTSPTDSSTVPNPNGNQTVTGSAASSAGVGQVLVAVQETGPDGQWWDAASGTWVSGPIGNPATLADPGGTSSTWTFSYPVPASGGTYQVTAYAGSSQGETGAPVESDFAVKPSATSPQIQTSLTFVPPAGSTTVSGSGFGDSEKVTIALAGTKLATAQTSASGTLPATAVTIPAKTDFGLASLTATGQSSGDSATAGITVANAWAMIGYDAGHDGFEPNDPNLFLSPGIGGGDTMALSWAYGASSAVSAPPAVADTVAYLPDSAGDLTALDVHSGAPLWTWSLPSGAALAAPAVDTGQKKVFVSAADGTLHAISTSTGKTVWSDTVGGDLTAPVFASGRLYVGSSTGTVEAVNEATGKKLWSVKLENPVSAAPAVDPTANLVIAGEANGDVKALTTSGARKWTASTGGPVTTPPVVSGGDVYFGSGDSVYSVSETSGATQWTYKTGGTIASSLAVLPVPHKGTVVTTGSADGSLYSFLTPAGTLLHKDPIGSPIEGVGCAYQTCVFDTAGGTIGFGRAGSGEKLWTRNTPLGAMTSPVIADGTIYAGGHSGSLYAYTTHGQPPA